MTVYAMRQPDFVDDGFARRRGARLSVAMMLCAMLVMGQTFAASHGAIAADASSGGSGAAADAAPVILAGRWTGPRYGNGVHTKRKDCENAPCTLTYDIVACGKDWCGIAVGKDDACGAIAMKVAVNTDAAQRNSFRGKLELAKGAAPYVIEAWYIAPDASDGNKDEHPRLSMIGDTGPELMMFRRSFPFSAELARSGDAKCTLEKATS